MTLGLSLNNPLNIKHSPIVFKGQSAIQPHPVYVAFDDALSGIRAACVLLHTYWTRDGIQTIAQAIARWAPASENPTSAYIENMAKWTGLEVYEPAPLPAVIAKLIPAMIRQESGQQPFPQSLIDSAITAAGITVSTPDPVPTNRLSQAAPPALAASVAALACAILARHGIVLAPDEVGAVAVVAGFLMHFFHLDQ